MSESTTSVAAGVDEAPEALADIGQRLEELAAENERLASRVRELERRGEERPVPTGHEGHGDEADDEVSEPTDEDGSFGRRVALRRLGQAAAASAGVVAAGGMLRPTPAQASSHSLTLGTSNFAETSTGLESLGGGPVLDLDNDGSSFNDYGLEARSSGTHGIRSSAGGGAAFYTASYETYGLDIAGGTTGAGRAHLRLQQESFEVGPPSSGQHFFNEIYMDGDSVLWICVASGTPGTWRKVHSSAFSNYLEFITPVRVMNTLDGTNHPAGAGPLTGNPSSPFTVDISGALPSGAEAMYASVTAVPESTGGWVTAWESGAWPGVANLTWQNGQNITNLSLVGLTASETFQLTLQNNRSAHVVIDALAVVRNE